MAQYACKFNFCHANCNIFAQTSAQINEDEIEDDEILAAEGSAGELLRNPISDDEDMNFWSSSGLSRFSSFCFSAW